MIAKKNHWIASIPAAFMTYNVFVYILYEKMGFNLPLNVSYIGGLVLTIIVIVAFIMRAISVRGTGFLLDEDVSHYKVNKM